MGLVDDLKKANERLKERRIKAERKARALESILQTFAQEHRAMHDQKKPSCVLCNLLDSTQGAKWHGALDVFEYIAQLEIDLEEARGGRS